MCVSMHMLLYVHVFMSMCDYISFNVCVSIRAFECGHTYVSVGMGEECTPVCPHLKEVFGLRQDEHLALTWRPLWTQEYLSSE